MAIGLVLLAGCAATGGVSSPTGQLAPDSAPAQPPAADPGLPLTAPAPVRADHIVVMSGALTRPYFLPTLAKFASDPMVSNVIVGEVTASRSTVSQPGNVVETILSISVDQQRNAKAPTTVTVREQGGVVRTSQVRSDFEDKIGRKLTPAELAETVDYQFEGTEHAQVGERVLVIVAHDDSSTAKNAYVSMARMKATAQGSARVANPTFTWASESPNPSWAKSVDAKSLIR